MGRHAAAGVHWRRLKERIEQLSALYDVSRTITLLPDLDEVLDVITIKAAHIMKARACFLRLLNEDKELVIRSSYGIKKKSFLAKERIKIGESISGRVAKYAKACIVGELAGEPRYKFADFAEKLDVHSLLSVPLEEKGIVLGVLDVYGAKPHQYDRDDIKILSMFASFASLVIDNLRLQERARDSQVDTIKILANIIDSKDNYTRGHSERVMEYAVDICRQLNIPRKQSDIIKYASYLHDLGKIDVDMSILKKKGHLTRDEWKEIFMHPKTGSDIVGKIDFLKELMPIILHHHERYDGGGYPNPDIKGENIPLGARILAVADTYEAMISSRPYRQALDKEDAARELKRQAGRQFDPVIVRAFLKIIDKSGTKRTAG